MIVRQIVIGRTYTGLVEDGSSHRYSYTGFGPDY